MFSGPDALGMEFLAVRIFLPLRERLKQKGNISAIGSLFFLL